MFDLPAAREQVVFQDKVALLTEALVPPVGTTVEDARQVCSDSDVSDCWSLSVGVRVPTVETTVCCAWLNCFDCDVPVCIPDLLESGRDAGESLSVLRLINVVLPEVAPAMVAGAAAVPMSLPAVAGVVSSDVLAGGGGGGGGRS